MMASGRAAVAVAVLGLVLSCSAQEERFELFNLTRPTYLRPGAQYQLVRVPDGLPVGNPATRQDSVVVWRNGIVTFGVASSTANLSVPSQNFSSVDAEYLVAPLWFRNVSTELVNSTVSWETETEEDSDQLLEFAGKAVEDYGFTRYSVDLSDDFSPTWAMIVTWNVSLIPEPAETERLCRAYFNCLCEPYRHPFDFYRYEDYSGESDERRGSGSAECPRQLCFAQNGWSHLDTAYLHTLCNTRGDSYYYYYGVNVQYQLVLATDGINTHAVFLYGCREDFYYDINVLTFIYNHSSIGHRLGDLHDNYTCISNEIPSLFRCDYIACSSVFQSSYFYFFSVASFLRNLTNGFDRLKVVDRTLLEGYDYIPFQLFSEEFLFQYNVSGNDTNSTFSDTNIQILSGLLDGSSDAIFHPGIAVGTTTQTKIYVGTNGVISFGRPFYFWYSQKFPTRYPWIRDTYVAAPLWMDMDMRSRGYVIYTTLKIGESPSVFESVNTFMTNQTGSPFKAEWLLVVLWVEVPIYPHYYVQKYGRYYSQSFRQKILNDFNTFEAIIASSGPETYAIYTYNCELLENPGLYRGPVIGYNLGGFEYKNHRLSETLATSRVACGNWPASNWFNLVYKLNTGEDVILLARKKCLQLLELDTLQFPDEKVVEYEKELSPCPCSIRNIWRDRNFRWDSNNFYCYYRRLANPATEDYDQYCCYDTNFEAGTWGALVQSGYRTSGMAKMEEIRFGRSISDTDMEMRRQCCGLGGLCDLFLKRRPPNNCSGYEPPVWTWAWGDPHITTLDGHTYTFNGFGEFVMLRYDNTVDFQARMRPTPGTMATQFSAFSFGYISGSKVEVDCGSADPFCTILYNEQDISNNLTSVNDSFYSSSDKIEVTRETETTVTVLLGTGLALAVSYNKSVGIPSFQLNLDPKLTGSMEGLLGNRDGNSTNDIAYRDGTLLDVSTATDEQIFHFGNDWLITTMGESLFSYEMGKGPMNYHNTSWQPVFTSQIMAEASDEVLAACTPEGATQPLQQCVFDATATNNVDVGMATTNTLAENTVAMMESTNFPPVISSDSEGVLSLSHSSPLSLTLSITDDSDTAVPLSLVSAPPGSSLSPSSDQPGSFSFTWQLQHLAPEEELPELVFVATDSLGATSTFSPVVEVCACRNGGQCTSDGLTFSSNLLILNCICPPAWEGHYCEADVDGCLENACIDGVECIDVPAPGEGMECGPCPVGYTDDGNKCADIDECSSEPCQQICTNTDGSYECSCNRGYLVDESNSSRCLDYDECSLLVEDCEQICTNTEGSFTCSCKPGFIQNGPFCFPEHDCEPGYVGCGSALCANISGEADCYCSDGYYLNTNATGCLDVNECDYGLCQHYCTNLPGAFHCSCRHGYQTGPNLLSCQDVDECAVAAERGELLCLASEACRNLEGSYECVCSPGLYPVFVDLNTASCGNLVVNERFKEHSVVVTFLSLNEDQLLEEGGLDTLTEVVVAAIKSYCSSEVCDIEGKEDNEAVTKRHTHLTFDPSEDVAQPVFDLDSLECGQDCVQIPFYVEVLQNDGEDDESDVLDKGDTLAAVQARQDLLQGEFGPLQLSLLFPEPSPSTQQPPVTLDDDDEEFNTALVAGVTATAAVVGVFFSVTLALILYLCVEWNRKRKNSGSRTDKRAVLRESVSWSDDGKGERPSEMGEVPPQGPRMTEDPGKTIFVNENTA